MFYASYMQKVKNLVIQQLENGTWYLEPEWRDILNKKNLSFRNIEDVNFDNWDTIEDVLKLETIRRNKKDDKTNFVINWFYDLITATVEPAIMSEEADYIKNVVEYMKVNHEINDRQEKNENEQ